MPNLPFNAAGDSVTCLTAWEWFPPEGAPSAPRFSTDGRSLTYESNASGDWWRKPGHNASSAGAYVARLPASKHGSDWAASVSVQGQWKQTFDQGCIFLHLKGSNGETRWVKAGVERDDGKDWIGSVVTLSYSDWAIASLPSTSQDALSGQKLRFSLSRQDHKLSVRFVHSDGSESRRDVNGFFADFEAEAIRVGVMACQPGPAERGVDVTFEDFDFSWK